MTRPPARTSPPRNANTIPGLTVFGDGLTFGQAELTLAHTDGTPITFGSIITFNDLRFGVENFSINFDGPQAAFNGSIFFATGGATLLPGKPVSAAITDSGTELNANGTVDTEAMRLTFVFSNGQISDFVAHVDTLTVSLGSFLTLSASNFNLDLDAGPDQDLVSFASVGATVKIGSLQIGGEAKNFAFTGDGSFVTKPGFGVFLSVGSATGNSFNWPSFLPIQIQAIGIQWAEHPAGPRRLHPHPVGLGHGPAGDLRPQLLRLGPGHPDRSRAAALAGQFPIVGITSLGVEVTGSLFGGDIDAELVGGIERLDSGFNIIAATDTTTPVAHRILYLGLQGGFKLAGLAGFEIQVGLSQLGPLDAMISVSLPEGIILDPDTGIAINNFVAGVQFFKTLPSITDPMALANPAFGPPTQITPAQWLASLQQQVAAQARATGGTANFAAAFEAPMTITGSATIFDIYTSQQLFNAQATVMISTDGKFLIDGQLNFADNKISLSGKLYADLSQVSSGSVTVLFLADIPDQVKLLTIFGKLQMGFENASGQQVSFDVVDPTVSPTAASSAPTATVADPAANSGTVDVEIADGSTVDANGVYITDPTSGTVVSTGTGQAYIDVDFTAATGANLDYGHIYSASSGAISLTGAISGAGTIIFSGNAIPLVTVNTETGVMNVPLMLENTSGADPDVFTYGPTRETVYNESQLACWTSNQCAGVDAQTLDSELMSGAAGVGSASHLDMRIDTITVNGVTMLGVTDLAKVVVLDKTASGLTGTALLTAAMDKMGVREFRYLLPAGDAFTTGTVTVTIAAGAVKNADTTNASGATVTGASNIATTNMFALEGPTAVLTNPGNGGTIDINVVNGRNWIDVVFNQPTCTTAPSCIVINQNSITSLSPKFTLGGAGLGTLALDSAQAPVLMGSTATTLTYRFWLTGEAATTSSAPVTLTFLANSWSYYLPSLPTLPSVTVGVTSSGGAFVGPVTVQITIPDAGDTGHTDPLLTGLNVDPTSLVLKDLVFTTTTTGWSVVIDPTRAITLVPGTTDEFNIPVLVTLPSTGLSATSSAVFNVVFQNATDIAYYGSPDGASQSGTNGGNTYTAASFPSNRSYVDIAFDPASGQTLGSVPSPGNGRITLSGSALNGVSFASGSPLALGGGVYRYLLTGSFVAGTVTVTVAAGAVTSNGARGPPGHQTTVTDSSLQTTMSFTVQGPTADVVVTDPSTGNVTSLAGGSIGRSVINGAGYIEISFHATSREHDRPGDDHRQRDPGARRERQPSDAER